MTSSAWHPLLKKRVSTYCFNQYFIDPFLMKFIPCVQISHSIENYSVIIFEIKLKINNLILGRLRCSGPAESIQIYLNISLSVKTINKCAILKHYQYATPLLVIGLFSVRVTRQIEDLCHDDPFKIFKFKYFSAEQFQSNSNLLDNLKIIS